MNNDPTSDGPPSTDAGSAPRSYIGVYFECCGVYQRVYRRPEAEVYVGRCPRCLRPMRVRVGRDGTSERIFRAS